MRREILRTRRLVVTSWRADDVESLFEIHSDAETMRFVRNGHPESLDETRTLVEQYMVEDETQGFTKWRLADVRDGALVGRAGFGLFHAGRELGYTIRRERWGQGLASEVAAALVTWHGQNSPGLPLLAHVAKGNVASVRVLRKCGFDRVGTKMLAGVECGVFQMAFA